MEYSIPVKSSAIEHVKYNDRTRMLTLTFRQGAEYDYPDVPEVEFHNLIQAPSVGKYFNQHIRQYSVNKKM